MTTSEELAKLRIRHKTLLERCYPPRVWVVWGVNQSRVVPIAICTNEALAEEYKTRWEQTDDTIYHTDRVFVECIVTDHLCGDVDKGLLRGLRLR